MVQLGLSKPKHASYNLCMADQTITKPLSLIKDLKILIHGFPYVMTFIVIQSSVLESNYYMLLNCPWLNDAKVSHDWGNNIITIQGTNIIKTIHVIKKLGAPTKSPQVLVCYDYHFGISNKKEDLMFATKPRLILIESIVILTSVWSYQPIELVHVLHDSYNIYVKLVHVLHVKIIIPPNTFKQLFKTFSQPKVGEMEIDKTPT